MKPASAQEHALWGLVMPPGDGLPLPGLHGSHCCPVPPSAALVSGRVLGTGRVFKELVSSLSAWFRVTREVRGLILLELQSVQGFHAFLRLLASKVDPILGVKLLSLLGVDPDRMVHLLHSFFSVSVVPCSMVRLLL